MKRETYNDCIRRFNAQDVTAFETYLAPNMHMQNGTLGFDGIDGMKNHCAEIWQTFSEEQRLAVQLWAHFTALRDDANSMFGPVKAGETFDFRGLIMYEIMDEKFNDTRVAYNSFTLTNLEGEVKDLGIPH